MTGNHWWKGGIGRRSRLESWNGPSSLPSGEDTYLCVDTNACDMCAQVACILVQKNEGEMENIGGHSVLWSKTRDMSQRDK
eukprot:scaffold10614_cov82-Skeletonema_dohrnii-CCMP3373.AAC.1